MDSPDRAGKAEIAPERAPGAARPAGAVLSLQRSIGNRATTQLLQRYQLEGPWNKADPVHEVITIMALKTARERIAAKGGSAGGLLKGVDVSKLPQWGSKKAHNLAPEKLDASVQQFVRGVIWADDPKGYLFDDDSGTENYSSGLMWFEEFDPDEKDEPEELIARSHYGDLQFFHGMASADMESATQTKSKMLEWARLLIGVAKGDIKPDTKLKDHPLTARLFTAHADYTIKQLFVYAKGSDTAIQQRALGTLFHMIQDSYAKGHVERNAAGEIVEFHSYEHQDHGEHGKYDAWAGGANLSKRFENTPGAARAMYVCADVAEKIDQGASTDDIVNWLDDSIFKLSSSARGAGPGSEFKKK